MRRCAGCQQILRQDDPGETVLVAGVGIFQGCRACARGESAPVRHPAGRDYPFEVCGVCRQALHDGERPQAVRLAAADVEGANVEPGCYAACAECVDHYRPKIAARLGRPAATVQGHWLL